MILYITTLKPTAISVIATATSGIGGVSYRTVNKDTRFIFCYHIIDRESHMFIGYGCYRDRERASMRSCTVAFH